MFDNKMIEYQRRIARINNKIKILSDNGYNVDNYNLTIQSIIDSCNNNVTTIKQGNAQVQIKNMNADAMYDEALKKLKDLENEIANEDTNIKMKKTYESILELSKDDDIDDDNFEKLDRTLVMASHELSKLKITDLEKGQELIKLLYKACYHVIKLEICKYGYSKLLVKINNLDQGCEFLNNVIKEDLDSFDLEDKTNSDIKKRLDELSKKGLDSSLCDLELIVRITVRDYPSLRIKINNDYINRSSELDWNNTRLISKKENKKERLSLKKKEKQAKIFAGIAAIMASISIVNAVKSTSGVEDNSLLYSEGAYSIIETYDTISGTTLKSNEYRVKDSNVIIVDYGKVDKNNKREVKTYHLNTSVLDAEDISMIDTTDLNTYDNETILYDDTQLSKESYKVIEKVLKRDETNTTEVLDEHKVKIHNTVMNICAQIAGVALGISIAELIIKRKEFKENNMEIDKLDKEIEDLMKKEEQLEDMYDELSKANDVVKTIHNPYRTKRK